MIRAVVDPGVLIAALIAPGGACAELIRAWQRGAFDLIVCPMLLQELTDTLLRPKFRRWCSEHDAVTFVEILRITASLEADPTDIPSVSRDPGDDYLVALARRSGAHVLVAGDGDLLALRDAEPPTVRPARFLAGLAGR